MAEDPVANTGDQTGELVPPGVALGRYQLLRKLARGGMAEVFLGRSHGAHGFEKTVAIKRILPKYGNDEHFIRMMVDEAKISVLLNHPNICNILEFGEQDGTHFIVMEYVPGQALSALMKRMAQQGKRLGVLESVYLCVEMLQGLHAAHVQNDNEGRPANIIHRDVSPQNLLVSYDGHVKIIDFGIARAKNRLEHTEIGTIKGKLRYLAPEMIDPARYAESGDFDHRVDVWAAGVVLHELVAWRKLFIGGNDVEVYEAIVEGEIPDLIPEGADPALMAIINKGLQRNPKHRYQSAEAFADDLRAYLYSNDPAFTSKRISRVLDEFFQEEKSKLLELEEPDPLLENLNELNLTSTHSARSSSQARMKQTNAERSRPGSGARSRPHMASPVGPPIGPSIAEAIADDLPHVAASALTQVVDPEELRRQEDARRATAGGETPEVNAAAGRLAAHHSSVGTDDVTRLSNPKGDGSLLSSAGASLANVDESSDTGATRDHIATTPKKGMSPAIPLLIAAVLGVFFCIVAIAVVQIVTSDKDSVVASPAVNAPATSAPAVVAPESDPTPESPPPAGVGTVPLLVASTPSGATVKIEGQAGSQKTPSVFMMETGKRVVVIVSADGYESYKETISVQEGDAQLKVQADLAPIAVKLIVTAKPKSATLTINGRAYKRPIDVRPGKPFTVVAKADGYRTQTKSVTAEVGGDLEVMFDLSKFKSKTKSKSTTTSKRGKGTLILTTNGKWGRVTIDGKVLDDTTPVKVKLSAGTHSVEVAHPPEGKVRTFKIKIEAGETRRKTVKF